MSKRINQAEALLSAFDWDVAHCRQVRDLAVQLFDHLQPLHQLGRDERDILEAAALLHDIGWTISHDKHHKHSYRLIHESQRSLAGFAAAQVELIANIARYHRKALPSLEHEAFAALSDAGREVVQKLAALLRIADGLDRPHRQGVRSLECRVAAETVTITIYAHADPEAHSTGGERKRDLFEQTFHRRLAINPVAVGSA